VSWWRRHRAALIALAVMLPAAFVTYQRTEWAEYANYRPGAPVDLADDGTATYAGATWELSDHRVLPEGAVGSAMPTGSALVVVTLRVDAEDREGLISCEIRLRLGERLWEAETDPDVFTPADGTESYCDGPSAELDGTVPEGPWEVQRGFLVPESALTGAQGELEVVLPLELPEYLRVPLG
jgi:hypothetical protein